MTSFGSSSGGYLDLASGYLDSSSGYLGSSSGYLDLATGYLGSLDHGLVHELIQNIKGLGIRGLWCGS
ncbi:hypothetical protein Pyn_29131 [Prunus yedoensis var. nudiflora]|uniref:Uncharacterized protein n=1 Tax=Prunus yedoensis var. nudiflora TaxID=2094558 RepID=A0A314XM62_PRUYE|nr:hypothetical protein Pyn_29131 [Prunus yedoensis var. nudiflora]